MRGRVLFIISILIGTQFLFFVPTGLASERGNIASQIRWGMVYLAEMEELVGKLSTLVHGLNIIGITVDSIPILGPIASLFLDWGFKIEAEVIILSSIDLQDMKTHDWTIAKYPHVKSSNYADLESCWEKLDRARGNFGRLDPEKALHETQEGLEECLNGIEGEIGDLYNDAEEADRIGLDVVENPEFSGNQFLDATRKTMEGKQKIEELSNIEKITRYVEDKTDEARRNGGNITLSELYNILSYTNMADKYNALFAGDGLFENIIAAREKIAIAKQAMQDEWKSYKTEYETTPLEKPEIDITMLDLEDIVKPEADPNDLVREGEELEKNADSKKKNAEKTVESKIDNYLFLGIREMKEALAIKRDAKAKYEMAREIYNSIRERIDSICEEELKPKTEIGMKYYIEGKELCSSTGMRERAEGARRIIWAKRVDSDPKAFLDSRADDVKRKMSELESLIKRARIDDIEVNHESHVLDECKKEMEKVENKDPSTIASALEIIDGKLDLAIKSIETKAYDMYKDLEGLREKVISISRVAKVDDSWKDYEYMFSGSKLMPRKGLGNLKRARETYKAIIRSIDGEELLDYYIEQKTRGARCNEYEEIQYTIHAKNRGPFALKGIILKTDVGDIWLDYISPYGEKDYTVEKVGKVVSCNYAIYSETNKTTTFQVDIKSKIDLDWVLTGISGELDDKNPFLEETDDGIKVLYPAREQRALIRIRKENGKAPLIGNITDPNNGNETLEPPGDGNKGPIKEPGEGNGDGGHDKNDKQKIGENPPNLEYQVSLDDPYSKCNTIEKHSFSIRVKNKGGEARDTYLDADGIVLHIDEVKPGKEKEYTIKKDLVMSVCQLREIERGRYKVSINARFPLKWVDLETRIKPNPNEGFDVMDGFIRFYNIEREASFVLNVENGDNGSGGEGKPSDPPIITSDPEIKGIIDDINELIKETTDPEIIKHLEDARDALDKGDVKKAKEIVSKAREDVKEIQKEAKELKNAFEKAGECAPSYFDLSSLDKPSWGKIRDAKDAYAKMQDHARSKINLIAASGDESKLQQAMNMLESGELCKILDLSVGKPEKAGITGMMPLMETLLPGVIVALIIVYMFTNKRRGRKDRIMKILKSSE